MEGSARARHRWHEAVRRVIEDARMRAGRPAPQASPRFAHLTSVAVNTLRFDTINKLQSMTISMEHQINEKHEALVRCLQFSPDGKYLVTSRSVFPIRGSSCVVLSVGKHDNSWDSQTFLFRINVRLFYPRMIL